MTYKITCIECGKTGVESCYYGESGSTAYTRGKSHVEGLLRKDNNNVLFEHNMEVHPELELAPNAFKMDLTGRHSTCLSRQSSEGIEIANKIRERDKFRDKKKIIIMNSKRQFHQPGLLVPKISHIEYGG